jgi:hypothetical protein
MQTDKWYLERRIYVAVGINISVASVLVLTQSHWDALHTLRRRRDGVVCRHWLLRDGQFLILAWGRAAAESADRAFRAMRGMRIVEGLRGR